MRSLPDSGDQTSQYLAVMRRRERGRLKIYIGSAAGVGKTYRMLQEAHELRQRGIDVVVALVESHGRAETAAQLRDLEVVPRRQISYRGVVLEEMDVDGVLARYPRVAVVDELAHTNVPGSGHAKRWQDVLNFIDAGISVISTVNVQHIESLNGVLERMLGFTVRETVPDWVIANADQVVNVDISAEDLRERLRAGKVYPKERVPSALANFFTEENLATLRELALREVASSVDRAREEIVRRETGGAPAFERLMVAMSSNADVTADLLRKSSRIAGRLNTDWICLWVERPQESPDRISAEQQRKLVENVHLAQTLGGEFVKVRGTDIYAEIVRVAQERAVRLVLVGQSRSTWWTRLTRGPVVSRLIQGSRGFDVMVVSPPPDDRPRGDRS